ncbi:hypothetical protein [Rhizomonospora bruguierae]|uniref:hypothetical protein n=1 Tax=Rhizomonospora bruguierae TaxID=1581705 RepID=UPI001BCD4B99|nr:hypothetical protein [Micromonospora sp. NBRC 107566]
MPGDAGDRDPRSAEPPEEAVDAANPHPPPGRPRPHIGSSGGGPYAVPGAITEVHDDEEDGAEPPGTSEPPENPGPEEQTEG